MKPLLVLLPLLVMACATPTRGEKPAGEPASLTYFHSKLRDGSSRFTVVCLGDSNTEVNWTSEGSLNWVGLLSAGLFESGSVGRHRVINAGVSGHTFADGLDRLDRDVLAFDPDLVIISFGTNDVNAGASPKQIEQRLSEMIRRIREFGPASLLVRTPVPFYNESAESPGWEKSPELAAIVEAIRKTARRENVAIVDHYSSWPEDLSAEEVARHMYNRLHPNGAGHARFYRELAPVLGLREVLLWQKKNEPNETTKQSGKESKKE